MHLWKKILMSVTGLMTTVVYAADQRAVFNMTSGVTPLSRDIYYLHMTIFWICVLIGIGVFGVLIYTLIRHRKAAGHTPARFHSSLKVELLWTVIPFVILIIMAIPATVVLIRMEDTAKADVNIKITGSQWKWQYEYLDYGINFISKLSTPQEQIQGEEKKGKWYLLEVDKPLVVPIHKKIRFLVTSSDVVHSWWVPALGVKRDAMPGFIHEAWARIDKPGIYRGQCAELCGVNHGYMPIVVQAVPQAEFEKWVEANRPAPTQMSTTTDKAKESAPLTKEALMSQGKQVFSTNCSVCHKDSGEGMPPAFPALKGSHIVTGPVAANIDIVLHGKSGTAMQAFTGKLSAAEIAAVITYVRNSWGNDNRSKFGKQADGVIQASDIAKQQ